MCIRDRCILHRGGETDGTVSQRHVRDIVVRTACSEQRQAVSYTHLRTLESAYDDYCVARMAKSLGKEKDYAYFSRRASYYKNLLDPSTTCLLYTSRCV